MKAKLLALLAVMLLSALAASYDIWHVPATEKQDADTEITPMQAAALPDFTFTTEDGTNHNIVKLPEPGIVLHFWASWCAPCTREFPALLARIAAAKGALALVAVSIDDDHAGMQRFMGSLGPAAKSSHLYWVWDRSKDISLKRFNTIRVPETILTDSHRAMTEKIVGDPGWNNAAIEAELMGLRKSSGLDQAR